MSREKPLVLLPAWVLDASAWSPLERALGPDYTTFVPRARGLGDAEISLAEAESWTLESAVDEITAGLHGLETPLLLVGCSAAATVALAVAASARLPIAGVISISGSPRWLIGEGWPYGYPPDSISPTLDALRADWRGTFEQALWSVALTDQPPGDTSIAASLALACAGSVRDPAVPAKVFERITHIDERADLAKIDCPVLLLHGEHDPIAPPGLGSWMAERIPNARLVVVPHAGHFPHMTFPRQIAAAIGEFWENEISPTRRA
jgi:pimeloyl-[acyl-carrier protein] methyl ester esterase